jgi:uncharacterized glyoxalase superfamily protein PhnB
MKKRKDDPWMSSSDYGHSLPEFTVNLLVKNVKLASRFYVNVFNAKIRYQDEDFAAVLISGLEFMLHADHTFESHPWTKPLATSRVRGLGVELRLLGLDPDEVEKRARKRDDVIITAACDKPHGWRETVVQDPDGYVWAVGVKIG